MRAEVIAIGDELTTGQRLDTNSQWISQQLTHLGVEVAFHTTVGDELDDNIAVFQIAMERVDIIVVTGGLGPTADDLTRDALAAASGSPLQRDKTSLRHIQDLFASRGREMPERNQVQADFPIGSTPIHNPHGTAPGIEMQIARSGPGTCKLFALPGVPAEMQEMWQATVAQRIHELRPEPRVIRHRRIKCFGMGESQLEAMLPDLIRRDREPRVGITASDATITLRITAAGRDEQACWEAIEPTVDIIYQQLGNLIFGEEEEELQHVVVRLLKQQKLTLAVADWATEGLLLQWLQEASGDTGVLKSSPPISSPQLFDSMTTPFENHTAKATTALAEKVRQDNGAHVGLALGAYPPEIQSSSAQVCVALSLPDNKYKMHFSCAAHPAIIKSRTAKQALNALRLKLQ